MLCYKVPEDFLAAAVRREIEDSKAFVAKLVDKALWDLLAARVRREREE